MISTSIAAQLWALESYDNIMLGYSKSDQYMDSALTGLLSGINFDGIQSIIDPAFKTLSGINVDTFTDAEVMELNRKRVNRYVREGGKNIFRQGMVTPTRNMGGLQDLAGLVRIHRAKGCIQRSDR